MTGSEELERLVIRLFGVLAIEDGTHTLGPRDLGGARPKQVLEILLAARGHRVPIDRLADLIWGEELPQNAAGSLQTFVSVLRRHLVSERERARELVSTEAEAYRFVTDRVELDLDRFDELLERSAREPTHLARRSLEQAHAVPGRSRPCRPLLPRPPSLSRPPRLGPRPLTSAIPSRGYWRSRRGVRRAARSAPSLARAAQRR